MEEAAESGSPTCHLNYLSRESQVSSYRTNGTELDMRGYHK
jgi:hypothetical protein